MESTDEDEDLATPKYSTSSPAHCIVGNSKGAQHVVIKAKSTQKQCAVRKSMSTQEQCAVGKSMFTQEQCAVRKSMSTQAQCAVRKSMSTQAQCAVRKFSSTQEQCAVRKSMSTQSDAGHTESATIIYDRLGDYEAKEFDNRDTRRVAKKKTVSESKDEKPRKKCIIS